MINWIASKGDAENVVISSKISLARNLEKSLFTDKMAVEEARDNVDKISNVLIDKLDNEKLRLIKLWEDEYSYVKTYVDELLISDELIKRRDRAALILNEDKTISIMINELDHVIIQCITDGLNLKEPFNVANKIDNLIEKDLSYAFHEDFGYLTATPTNVGTGMKVAVMLHLPALSMSEEIGNISKGLSQLGMSINPVYIDGSKSYGNIYEVSNRISLGVNEEEIINNLEGVIKNIIDEEKKFRETLIKKYKYEIEDKICRAYGVLKSAKLISFKEALELLSYVRLGCEMLILDIDKEVLNKLLIDTKDEILQKKLDMSLNSKERNIERAKLIQNILG